MEIRQLAEFVYALEWDQIPEHVKQSVKQVVFDTVGVGIGASRDTQLENVIHELLKVDGNDESVGIWGQNKKASLLTAVFLNAMASHTLELDDVHTNSKTHIGTVVVPAAWGYAEFARKSGVELLLAVVCAYEVVARIGMALGVSSHRNKGWHATSTAGIFGAAVACGKLMGLTVDELASAMGMAGEEAGGTWAFLGDGASCKVLNPAMAAVNGVKCAIMAKAGMTGPEHVLTAQDGGMFLAMSDEFDVSMVTKHLGTVWEVEHMDNKPYPCCRSTHCAIDGTLWLRKSHEIQAVDVDHVDVYTYFVGYKQCGMSTGSLSPKVPVEARFSSPFTVASALLFGEVGLKQFEQENIDNDEVQELLTRVKIIPDDSFTSQYPTHWGCRVKIYMKDGKEYETTIRDASGSVDNPLTEKQLIQKITGVLKTVGSAKETEKITNLLLRVEDYSEVPCI